MSTVQILSCLLWMVLISFAAHCSEWQLTDQVACCHGDRSFVCYLQPTAQQVPDAYRPLFNESHHVFNQPFSIGRSLTAGLFHVQCRLSASPVNSVSWPRAVKNMGLMVLTSLLIILGKIWLNCLFVWVTFAYSITVVSRWWCFRKPALTCRCNHIPAHFWMAIGVYSSADISSAM